VKHLIFSFLLTLAANAVFAQEALPSKTLPVTGEFTIRYTPKFESRCVSKTYQRKDGEFFGTSASQVGEFSVFEESPGVVKLSMSTQMGAENLRLTIGVNEDRSGFSSTEPELQSDIQMSLDDQNHIQKMKPFLFKIIKSTVGIGVGIPLHQGSNIPMGLTELCDVFPGGVRSQSQSGNYSLIGSAVIKGRDSVVFSGEKFAECIVRENQGQLRVGELIKFRIKGWQAVDRQSGLPSEHSFATVMSIGEGSMTTTDDRKCEITGASSLASQGSNFPSSTSGIRNSEQRLVELKSLLDKGLITQEHFDKKRAEILDAL
jgi:hypothetical protein